MSVQNPALATGTHCGCCNHSNAAHAEYCAGCGQSLREPCSGCGKPVLLIQSFCGSCGENLDHTLQSRHRQHETWMSEAITMAKNYEFDSSISMLQRVASLNDHRFAESVEKAKQAIEKVRRLSEQWISKTETAAQRAKIAFDNNDKTRVVQLLGKIPSPLLDSESRQRLAKSKSFLQQASALRDEVQSALESQQWPLLGALTEQLLELAPSDSAILKLAHQVGKELLADAKRSFHDRQYEIASQCLESIPSIVRSNEFEEIRSTFENVHWLSQQFDPEPYATPALGRLAVRFAKGSASDNKAKQLIKQLAARLKEGSGDPRIPSPAWTGSAHSWLGGHAAMLGFPQSIAIRDQPAMRSLAGRFTVAIGLAMQGLGEGRITENFAPKSSRIASLARRKNRQCWGIDVGSSGIKAVCLQKDAEKKLTVIDSFDLEFAAPLCRGSGSTDSLVIGEAIGMLLETVEIGDTPVWANLNATELISRFVQLPPVKDKRAHALIDAEIKQRVPLAIDDLDVVRWLGDPRGDGTMGRAALISVARKQVVANRLDLLTTAGLRVAGLQADPIAIVNFASYEFADLWVESADSAADDNRSVAIIDSGAAATTLLFISRDSQWFRTIESGGEDLTTQLARSAKLTHAEADQLKRNVAALDNPQQDFAEVERKITEVRSRIEKMMSDEFTQNEPFHVVQSWCVGGNCLTHSWIRRVMLQSPTTASND